VNKILSLITGIAVPYKTNVELESNIFVEQAKVIDRFCGLLAIIAYNIY
jgi:hypothetical protein